MSKDPVELSGDELVIKLLRNKNNESLDLNKKDYPHLEKMIEQAEKMRKKYKKEKVSFKIFCFYRYGVFRKLIIR